MISKQYLGNRQRNFMMCHSSNSSSRATVKYRTCLRGVYSDIKVLPVFLAFLAKHTLFVRHTVLLEFPAEFPPR